MTATTAVSQAVSGAASQTVSGEGPAAEHRAEHAGESAPAQRLAIRCRGLVKRYGDVTAVNGLDLEVRAGECFGLLGPNGAGKTTTVEVLEGLIAPTAGDITVLGMRWATDERALRERIGLALQETQLHEHLTVRETLALFRSFYRAGRTVEQALRLVSLEDKQHARYGQLSGGQKQRLAVACALVGDPELLFLDEPTTGLDPQSRRQLWDLISEFRASGATVVLTTHYMDEAERLCDRVAVVDHGKVIALGSPRELIGALAGREVVEFTADAPLDEAALGALTGVCSVRAQTGGWVLTVDALHVALPALLAHLTMHGARPTALATHVATLEDVFLHHTGRQLRE